MVAAVAACLLLTACRREASENRDAPGGPYYERLSSSGKRVMIYSADGEPFLKLRRRPDRIKVYSPDDMTVLGSVVERDGALSMVGPDADEVTPISGDDSMELPGRLIVERVTDGWAVIDDSGATLAYLARGPDGESWTLRDDYSSPPRLKAGRDDGRVVAKAGNDVVVYTYDSEMTGAELLALSLEKIDPLARVFLARWLAARYSDR